MAMTTVTYRAGGNAVNDHFLKIFSGIGTWDAASAATATGVSDTIVIPGVILGDIVLGVSASVAMPAGTSLTADVTAADTVTVKVNNVSGGAVDLASAVYRVVVGRMAAFPNATGL